jgi:hypothetical protein
MSLIEFIEYQIYESLRLSQAVPQFKMYHMKQATYHQERLILEII